MTPLLVFASEPYAYLCVAVCSAGGPEVFEQGLVEVRIFPDGERYRRVGTSVRGRDVALIAGTISDEQTAAVFDMACGLVEGGARSLTLIVPYFGYSTMDRADKPGEVVTAKTRAALLSSIPPAAGGNTVVLIDPHSEGLAYYFDSGVRTAEIPVRGLIGRLARARGGEGFVLASTDLGRAKFVQSLARELEVPAAVIFKRRVSADRTEVVSMLAEVKGKQVVIYDDMIRSGASMLGAARAYRDAGAARISAITTHGVFPGDSLEKLRSSGLIERLISTDTHPRAAALADRFLSVEPIAPVIAEFLTATARSRTPAPSGTHAIPG
jgi:ribose-phosphate pyrophosphokinase